VKKPTSALVMATAIVMTGIFLSFETRAWAPIAIALVFAIACVVYYFLSKTFFIAVHAHGGPSIHLVFKPNVIEGVPINAQQAFAVVGVIRDLILSIGNAGTVTPSTDGLDGFPSVEEAQPAFWSEMKPEEERMQTPAEDDDPEEAARELYAHARELAQGGDNKLAIDALKEVMRRFPKTQVAQKARRNLDKAGVSM
jgi:hypothetical protein